MSKKETVRERTERRQLLKKSMDMLVNLSNDGSSDSIRVENLRLLDEGYCLYGDGSPRFYLKKHSHERFLEALEDDKEIPIKLSHKDECNDPIQKVGYCKKSDFSLVDDIDEQGRQALDVSIVLNNALNCVQDVIVLSKTENVALSAEIVCKVDWELSEELGCPVYDEYDIEGIAIVAEGGNASSNGIKLGEKEMKDEKEKMSSEIVEEEKVEEIVEEELAEEEAKEEEAVEDTEESTEEDEEEKDETEEKMEEVKDLLKELQDEVARLNKENQKLSEKLSAKTKREKEFFESLSLSINPAVDARETKKEKLSAVKATAYDGLLPEEE